MNIQQANKHIDKQHTDRQIGKQHAERQIDRYNYNMQTDRQKLKIQTDIDIQHADRKTKVLFMFCNYCSDVTVFFVIFRQFSETERESSRRSSPDFVTSSFEEKSNKNWMKLHKENSPSKTTVRSDSNCNVRNCKKFRRLVNNNINNNNNNNINNNNMDNNSL